MSTNPSEQTATGAGVLVLGACGSGLGAATDALRSAGLSRGSHFDGVSAPRRDGADDSRPPGADDLDDRLLSALRWTWDAPPAAPPADPPDLTDLVRQGEARAEALAVDGVWFLADARRSLLLPWWRRILHERFVALLMVRDPLTVARRLEIRHGLPLSVGVALWGAYHRHLARSTSALRLVVVDQSAMVREPYDTIRRMLDGLYELGVPGPLDYASAAAAIRTPRAERSSVDADEVSSELLASTMRLYTELTRQPVRNDIDVLPGPPPPSETEALLLRGWRDVAIARRLDHRSRALADEELASARTRARAAETRARDAEGHSQRLAREEVQARRSRDQLAAYVTRASRTLPGRISHRWDRLRLSHPRQTRRFDAVVRTATSAVTLRRPRGMRPHPLFDPDWYRSSYPDVADAGADPWRHYWRHGAAEHRQPNQWFDVRWYLEQHPDVPRDPLAALDHYLYDGAWEGRDPGPTFASLWYLRDNPDVAASGMNPLVHYLRAGRHEGRRARPERRVEAPAAPLVSVIMTTFDSANHVGDSIRSLLTQSLGDFELIVVDDASRDHTLEVVAGYARADERVLLFASHRNHGTYWCKNFALTQARGEYVTFQDSDDRSEPDRLAQQVEALHQDPQALMASVDYVRVTDAGHVVPNRGVMQRRAVMALMYRRHDVVSRIGYYDSVRTSADQEHLDRFLTVFGKDALVHREVPSYRALVREGSLTGARSGSPVNLVAEQLEEGDISFLSPERQAYVRNYQGWHQQASDGNGELYVRYPPASRPFPVPAKLEIGDRPLLQPAMPTLGAGVSAEWAVSDCHPGDVVTGHLDHEVVILSDFCFPGGTSQANVAEIEALAQAERVPALCQADSTVLMGRQPLHPRIQELTREGKATWLQPGDRVRCRLLVVRHPTVIPMLDDLRVRIDADRIIVIVNQVPVDRDGTRHYDVQECQATMMQVFGSTGTWYPISPTVRESLVEGPPIANLTDQYWYEIIDVDAWTAERPPAAGRRRPVIGRHSRPSPGKWPADEATLRSIYPTDGSVEVAVLGGAAPAEELLGELPPSWVVHEFGQLPPKDFLRGLDFFVYYHHPDLVEAFGRTVLEALATGVPVILPRHFEPIFGESSIYAEPDEVQAAIWRLWDDREAYQRQRQTGLAYAQRHFSFDTHVQRVEQLLMTVEVRPDGQTATMA